jgi:hypothetical protein
VRFSLLAFASAAAFALALAACEKVQENIVLSPQGEQVEIIPETPPAGAYVLVGLVASEAAGATVEAAEDSARNDLRNKAAAMGASVVVIDEDSGSGMPMQKKAKVSISARAFKQKD